MPRFFNRPAQKKTEEQLDAELLNAVHVWANDMTVGGVPPIKIIRAALEAGADPNACDTSRETPLLILCKKRGSAELVKELIDAGAWVNAGMENGDMPILRAAAASDEKTMRVLLDHDADIHAVKRCPSRWPNVPDRLEDIYFNLVINNADRDKALFEPSRQCMKMIMDMGLPVPKGEISLIYLARPHLSALFPGMAEAKKLDAAVITNNIPRVKEILAAGVKADIAADFGSDQALFTATTNGNIALMDVLLKSGADINRLSPKNNLTPLQCAATSAQKEAFDYLLTAGADPTVLGSGTGDSILSVAKAGGIEEYAKESLARHSVTVQKPIALQKPLSFKPGAKGAES